MLNRWRGGGGNDRFYLLGLQNHCSCEIKRCLVLRRKAVTNLDSVLKNQRHHFTDKGPYSQSYGFSSSNGLEKAMAPHSSTLAWKIPGMGEPGGLPSMGSHRVGHDWSNLAAAAVIMDKCENWTIKRAECRRIDAFELWSWRRLLRVPWRSNQSILKEINPEYSLEGLMMKVKLQYFGHLVQRADSLEDSDAGKDWRQEEKGATEDEMIGWHHWLNGHEFDQTLEGQGSLVCCRPWGCKELDTTSCLCRLSGIRKN